jgi:hypothetical protein
MQQQNTEKSSCAFNDRNEFSAESLAAFSVSLLS